MFKFKKNWEKIRFSELRNINITKFNNIVVLTLAISAFFFAFKYFSAESELKITIHDNSNKFVDYNLNKIKEFYLRQNFEIPNYLNKIFKDQKNKDPQVDFDLSASDIDLIKTVIKYNWRDSSSWINLRIQDLEKQIDNLHHNRYIFGRSDAYSPKLNFLNILKYLKVNHSRLDYYIFLCAGLNSRRITQTILIKNTGDMHLQDIEIIIPNPVSHVTKSRIGNIIDYKVTGFNLFNIKQDSNSIKVSIPNLKKEKVFSLTIVDSTNKCNTSV